MSQPPPPPDDAWPVNEEPTLVGRRETVVAPEPPPPPAGLPPDRRVGAGMLLALGAIALVAIGALVAYLLIHHHHTSSTTTTAAAVSTVVVTTTPVSTAPAVPKVAVPRLLGTKVTSAEATLDRAGLVPTTKQVSSSKPAGTVLDVAPPAGTNLAKGSKVALTVAAASSGAATTTAPTTTSPTTTSPATTTAPTTTAPAQPTTATVPDASSQTEQAAATAFNQAGVLPSIAFVPSSDPLGTIESQAKAAGTSVPYHSHVQINVSKGPNAQTNESVPNVVGQSLEQAVATLNGTMLRLIYVKYPVTSRTQAGKIVQQSPLQGAQAPKNAQVLVFVGSLAR